jgi:hypothetical protein
MGECFRGRGFVARAIVRMQREVMDFDRSLGTHLMPQGGVGRG